MERKRKIQFIPDNVSIDVADCENLLRAAIAAGVHINSSCGGEGVCGKCRVIISQGTVACEPSHFLDREELDRGYRLACQCEVRSDLVVEIPVESRLDRGFLARKREGMAAGLVLAPLDTETLATGWQFNPALIKRYVELPQPTLQDNISDLSRLLRGIKQQHGMDSISVDFPVIRNLPHLLREAHCKVTSTIAMTRMESRLGDYQFRGTRRPKIICLEAGDTTKEHYSVVMDIGTTTVWGQLLDLSKGEVLAEASEYNGQIGYGEDVISRIVYSQKPGGLEKLQQVVVETMNGIIDELIKNSGTNRQRISHMTAAGNTTMTHLLLRVDPKYVREAPYCPAANFFPPVRAMSLGLHLPAHVFLYTFPCVASYVGGDIVSGILGSGVYQRPELTLYIDIGTNGEIVIGNNEWLTTAACSAGPAFEGGGLRHGMRATTGAIEELHIDPQTLEPRVWTIGKEKPKGICGSGIINIVAELLEACILQPNGKFDTEAPTRRIREGSDGMEYLLAGAGETQTGEDLVVTEVDIDNLMRAKAAMYAGYKTLVEGVGLSLEAVERIIIAGAFGSYINLEKAITIGLLPDLPLNRFRFIGNGSLLGARLISFSNEMLDDGERISRMMTNFELSENTEFMNQYMAALFLPHTDVGQFPTVGERLDCIHKDWKTIRAEKTA